MAKTLSTGVLRRHSSTQFLTVEALNLDPDSFRSVSVLFFDWSSGLPIILPMVDPSTVTIPPNSYRTFRTFQLPPTLFAYEVRILHPKDKDVIVSAFGLSDIAFDPQVGNNAMQHDLVAVKLK